MVVNYEITAGKYEAARYIHDEKSAKEYLETCIRESIHNGINIKEAQKIEIDNIMHFVKQYYDRKTQRKIYMLLMHAAIY